MRTRLVQALGARVGVDSPHLWDAVLPPLLNVSMMAAGVVMLEYVTFLASTNPILRLLMQASLAGLIYGTLVFCLEKEDIRWSLEVAGPPASSRLRRNLERWI